MANQHRMNQTTEYSFVGALSETAFLSLFALLCLSSALWMLQDTFPDWQLSDSANMWICSSVVFTIAAYEIVIPVITQKVFRQPGLQWMLKLMVPVIYGLVCCRNLKAVQIDFEDGSCAFAVQYLDKFNRYMKTSFYIWRGKTELLGTALAVWVLMIVLALLILALISKMRVFLLLLPTAALTALLLVGYAPEWKGIASFFAAVLFTFTGETGRRHAHLVSVNRLTDRRIRTQVIRLLPVLCLTAVVALVAAVSNVLFTGPAVQLMEKAPQVKAFQKSAEQKISDFASGFFLQRREHITNQSPHYTGKEVLKLTASKEPKADIYLRGFYGTDYENGSWICRKQAFADASSRAGYTQEQVAGALLQASYRTLLDTSKLNLYRYLSGTAEPIEPIDERFLDELNDKMNRIDYTLEYTGMNERYAYLPYFTDPLQSSDKSTLTGDVLVQKGRNQKMFTVTGWNGTVNDIILTIENQADKNEMFQWYDSFANSAYLTIPDRVPAVSKYLWTENFRQEVIYEQFAGIVQDGENAYLPKLMQDMEGMLDKDKDIVHSQMRLAAAWLVSDLMHTKLSYNLHPKPLPAGRDVVDYFLSESHEGFCVHFASAAALILRAYGIPTRYVSGYIARSEDFEIDGDTYVVSVKDHDAHAWVEVYINEIGWVPIEATPGTGRQDADAAQARKEDTQMDDSLADDTQTNETQTDDSQADETQTDKTLADDSQTDETQNTNGNEQTIHEWNRLQLVLRAAAVIALLSLTIFFIYVLIRSAIYRYQYVLKKELQDGNFRKAMLRLNRRVCRRLHMRGRLFKNSMTDAEYEQALRSAYQEISKEEWARYMQVVKAAAFSGEELKATDAYFCYSIYRRLL